MVKEKMEWEEGRQCMKAIANTEIEDIKALIAVSRIPEKEYVKEKYDCKHFSFDAIQFLRNHGIPASFAIVYHCIWELNHALVAIPFNKSGFVLFDVAGGTPIECYTIQEAMWAWNKLLIFSPAICDEDSLSSYGEENIVFEYPPDFSNFGLKKTWQGLRCVFFTMLCAEGWARGKIKIVYDRCIHKYIRYTILCIKKCCSK